MGPGFPPQPRRASWLRVVGGPLVTLAAVALIEVLRPTPLHVPGPGVWLVIAVAWSTFVGGLAPGLLSCAITVAYAAWFFLTPDQSQDPAHVRRFVDVVVGAPAITLMMGLLRRGAERGRRLAAEAAVAEQYAMLFEEAVEPMLLSDATHRYVFVNRAACEMSGYAPEELLRMRVGDLVSRSSLAERPLGMDELRRHGEVRTERELVRRDGTVVRIEVAARRLGDGSTLAILRDVTHERESVERLQLALARMHAEKLELVRRLEASGAAPTQARE